MLTTDLEVECPYCREINILDISNYAEDELINLRDMCILCGNEFSYDVSVGYTVTTFRNA